MSLHGYIFLKSGRVNKRKGTCMCIVCVCCVLLCLTVIVTIIDSDF